MRGQIEVPASVRPRHRAVGRDDRLSGIPNTLQLWRIPEASPNHQRGRRYAYADNVT